MIQGISFQQKPINKSTEADKYLPYKTAVISAAGMAGLGLATDYFIMNKILKMPTSKKFSLTINGAIGLISGIYSFFNTRKLQKEKGVKNIDDYVDNYYKSNF